MPSADELKDYIQKKFSEHLGLSQEEIFGADLTLAALITRSERMANSVDLMEAFARTSNALRREHGLRVRLPALALDTRISKVLEVFLQEVQRQREERAA
ncbi:MAG: hypothetical protein JXB05_23175 [Myxococcaceae bacterium]|nr:hypothetical protein [Myxococcaceae bacterium]